MINRYTLTKTETASKGGLDPTGEAAGVVQEIVTASAREVKRLRPTKPCFMTW